jgi:hypothetical protein
MVKSGEHKGIKYKDQTFHEWDCTNCGGSYMHGDNIGLWRSAEETAQDIKAGHRGKR